MPVESALERWKRLEPLLDAALDLEGEPRRAYIDAACQGSPELRAELEGLITWCERDGGFLEQSAPRAYAALLVEPGPAPEGARIGAFRIVQCLGQGGMGTVYLADRADGQFEQRVALKLIRGVYSTGDYLVRRFLEERRILASLEHPGIARIIDGGVLPDGLPWFAMEYVEGLRIDRHCDQQRRSIDERLRLFLDVCDAVQYAHRNLVVHRDLKPSNILVTESGSAKLLDFGIARLLTQQSTAQTGTALHLLTPDYASPEQVRGEPVTTATDVYSLGVILYELISGERPYRLAGRTAAEIERTISLREITPPSEMASRTGPVPAGARATTPERLRRRLRGDLDTITLAALRKEPDRRYGSVEQFAEDIRRHLDGRPVSARRDTIGYRSLRFIGRHRVGVVASATILSLLIGTSVVTQMQSVQVRRERDKAEQLSGFLVDLFAAPDPWYGGGASLTVRELLDSGAARISRELAAQPEIQADLLSMMGRSYSGLGLFDRARALFDSALAASRRANAGDLRVSRDLMFLGMIAMDTEDFAAAESLSVAALALRRGQVPAGSPELTNQLLYLAEVFWRTGRAEQAEPLVREAVAIERERHPIEPLRLAVALNDLGHVLRERGDPSGAETNYREALALRQRVLGDGHPDVANLQVNIARVRHAMGDTAAVAAMHAAVEVKRRAFGEGHPEIALDQSMLAGMLADRDDLAAADSLYRTALATQRHFLRSGHTRTAITLLGMGRVRLAQGDTGSADTLIRESLLTFRAAPWRDQRRIAEGESLLAITTRRTTGSRP